MAITLFFSFVYIIAAAEGYSHGAPFSTCLTMFPKHGPTERQTGTTPFRISLSPSTYRPGSIVTVELISSDGRPFRGLQVKASRSTGDTETVLGTFVQAPANKTKVFTCEGGYKNMVSHSNMDDVRSVILLWKAPEKNVGDIRFTATFVENFTVFWTGVISLLQPVQEYAFVPPDKVLPNVTAASNDVDLSTCGISKGCFLYPRYCSDSNCKAAATFRQDNDNFLFELMAKDSTFVSIGFSDDVKMGDDETVTCTADDEMTSVQHGFNPALHNVRMVTDQLTDPGVRLADGKITCSFHRPRMAVTRAINQSASELQLIIKTYDLYDEYFLMLAWGTVKLGTDVMNKHKELPPVTDGKVSFQKYKIHRGSALPVEARTHAALMAVSWVLLAGLTTAMSRYFKPWLGMRLFYGSNMWFQVHRVTGILTGMVTIASVILIFVAVGGFAEKEKKHAIVGLTVASMVVVQVVAGLLRPDKGADGRILFNWGHRILGQCAHILSAAAMYLAFGMQYIPSVMQDFGVAVLTGWVAVQIVWTIVFELRRCCSEENSSKKDQRPLRKELTHIDSILLYCYTLTLLLATAAILSAICIF